MKMTADVVRVLAFVNTHYHLPAAVGMKGLGLERDGQLIAGVIYEGFNEFNVWMHVAAQPGGRWIRWKNAEFIRYAFAYPFDELGCKRVSGYVNDSNRASNNFCRHLGFSPEARLAGAAPDGGDVVIYCMTRKDCRYVV